MKCLLNIRVPVSIGYDVKEKRYSHYPHGASVWEGRQIRIKQHANKCDLALVSSAKREVHHTLTVSAGQI